MLDYGAITEAVQSSTNNTYIPAGAEWESYYERFLIPSGGSYNASFTAKLYKNGKLMGEYHHNATVTVNLLAGYSNDFKIVLPLVFIRLSFSLPCHGAYPV